MFDFDVKSLRERLGWTQERLAAELGVDRSMVSRIESGRPTSGSVLILLRRLRDDVESGAVSPEPSPSPALETTGTAA